jgi:thiosulfate reductase cytochrome b subunit
MGSLAAALPDRGGSNQVQCHPEAVLSALVLALLPIRVLAGLAMSPRLDAASPELLTIFGGRRSARTIHFIAASTLVIFVIVHVFMVLISGVWSNMRSIITGRYWIETRAGTDA